MFPMVAMVRCVVRTLDRQCFQAIQNSVRRQRVSSKSKHKIAYRSVSVEDSKLVNNAIKCVYPTRGVRCRIKTISAALPLRLVHRHRFWTLRVAATTHSGPRLGSLPVLLFLALAILLPTAGRRRRR
jgi:hypothetical protein